MQQTDNFARSLPPETPSFTLYRHNLDDEYSKFADQLYAYIPVFEGLYHKYFQKVFSRSESNEFANFDIFELLPELQTDILKNPDYFDKQNVSRFKPIFERVSAFQKVVLAAAETNSKSADNIETTSLLFKKIQPFKEEILAKFVKLELNFDVDTDYQKIHDLFDQSLPVLKQYKKAVYKLQGFPLSFGLTQQKMAEMISGFSRKTLELEDIHAASENIKEKLGSLSNSVKIAEKLNLERGSSEAVCSTGVCNVYFGSRSD